MQLWRRGDPCENDAVLRYVVPEGALEGRRDDGDTAWRAVAIDSAVGSELLEMYVERYEQGRSKPRTLDGVQEIMYVVSGRGALSVAREERHWLEPGTAVYLTAGESYEVENPGPEGLLIVSATAPQAAVKATPERRTVRYADRPTLPASGDREFRYLVTEEAGCRDLTQFFGVIAPGRAPEHSHVYDEVIYVLEGEGVMHTAGQDEPVSAGSCIHIPPLLVHSLENSGASPMRIVAVFHPAGDPASRAYEANE
jgi:mannose-6-phosphate isomerase-like protein (cupin superfamily)